MKKYPDIDWAESTYERVVYKLYDELSFSWYTDKRVETDVNLGQRWYGCAEGEEMPRPPLCEP